MENGKAKNLIIAILIILLLACLGVVVWQYININKVNNVVNNEDTTNTVDDTQLRQEIASLQETIALKDKEITSLKAQNAQLKDSQEEVKTVVKNEYVPITSEKIEKKAEENFKWVVGVVEANCSEGQLTFYITENGGVEAMLQRPGDESDYSQTLKEDKVYKVEKLTKKVVGLYSGHYGQAVADTVIAIMEDETIECLYINNGKIVSTGKISGISNVVRIEEVRMVRNTGNVLGGHRQLFAVQGNGNIVHISATNLDGE